MAPPPGRLQLSPCALRFRSGAVGFARHTFSKHTYTPSFLGALVPFRLFGTSLRHGISPIGFQEGDGEDPSIILVIENFRWADYHRRCRHYLLNLRHFNCVYHRL